MLERSLLAEGASTRNAGFLTCGNVGEMWADASGEGEEAVLRAFDRRRRGIEILLSELPVAEPASGSADFDGITEEKRAFAARLNAVAPLFTEREVPFGGGRVSAFVNGFDRPVDPMRLWIALHGDFVAHGARVTRIGGGEAEVRLDGGLRTVRYGHAFLCTNGFAGELDAGSDVLPGRGQAIVTAPCEGVPPLLGYRNDGYDYFRPVEGRLLVGGGRQLDRGGEGTREFGTTPAILAHLRGLAREILGHSRFEVEHAWSGIMGFPGGRHHPTFPRRRIDGRTETVAGCGGMGVALAPLVAREIAGEFR